MAVKVVDASAIAAVLLAEPAAKNVIQILDGATLVAPALLDFELANVCLVNIRRDPQQLRPLAQAFRMRDRFGIEMLPVDHSAVLDLAAKTGLTVYDAAYLWLSRHLGADLVTLDKQLAKAEARFR